MPKCPERLNLHSLQLGGDARLLSAPEAQRLLLIQHEIRQTSFILIVC
uniref:Uncharacterized protein n=1 Tax=Anguilla anguilla TaxID=7936 RepID=A0A0E9PW12_ANGAN